VNEEGGSLGRKVEILSRDSGGRPEIAVREFKRAVLEDHVDFIITTDGSGVALALCPVAKELKTVLIISTASTIKYQMGICNRYTFRTGESSKFFTYSAAKIAATKEPWLKRWVGINPDYEWGHVSWEGFQKYLKQLNPDVEFAGNFFTPFGSADYRPYISKILDLKPDGVVTALWTGELVTFIKQAKMYGFFERVKRFVDTSSTTLDASMILGKEMVEMFGNTYYYFGYPDTAQNRKFIKDYRTLTGEYPISSAGATIKSGLYLKSAIEKAGTTDKEKVIDSLEGLRLETFAGGKGWVRPKDHQVQSEYMVTGKTGPDPNYPFWIFKDILLIPGNEGNTTEDEIEGCK
jgi:branched-chain amino acid transport system substrate-binding protein